MAKNKVSEWSSNPANNTDIGSIDIAEGCAPSGINNAIREVMAQVKDMITGADGDSQVVGGNLTVNGTTTLTGDATAPTQLSSDNSTKVATTAYVTAKVGTLGTMASQNANAVAITGGSIDATTTTQSTSDNSTKLASTAYVKANLATLGTNANGNRTVSTSSPTGGSSGDIWYKY